jgi:hypothetical protein
MKFVQYPAKKEKQMVGRVISVLPSVTPKTLCYRTIVNISLPFNSVYLIIQFKIFMSIYGMFLFSETLAVHTISRTYHVPLL